MPYVEGRVVHDADSHICEPPAGSDAEGQALHGDNFVDVMGPRLAQAARR